MPPPPKPKRCQAPGCGQPIQAARLRRHPTAKTCSDDCRDAHRQATMSRPARAKRHADRVQKAGEKRVARALKAVRATGWEYVAHEHYLRLACSKGLATRFDASIPQEHTKASWLCEMVETLMSTQGARAQALNQQVAQAGPLDRQDDPMLGDQEIRSRISSFLWADIVKRARKDHAASPTDWIRKRVAWAVQPPMDWTKKRDPVPLPKGSTRPEESTGVEGGQPDDRPRKYLGTALEGRPNAKAGHRTKPPRTALPGDAQGTAYLLPSPPTGGGSPAEESTGVEGGQPDGFTRPDLGAVEGDRPQAGQEPPTTRTALPGDAQGRASLYPGEEPPASQGGNLGAGRKNRREGLPTMGGPRGAVGPNRPIGPGREWFCLGKNCIINQLQLN